MMNKAKIDGATPRHCYFWIATLTNGQIIPEYDFNKSKHYKTKELPIEYVNRFCFCPVTIEFLIKVKKQFNEELKLAIDDKIHGLDINLEQGERLRTHPIWRNKIAFMQGHGISIHYVLFKTTNAGKTTGFFIDEHGEIVDE